MRKSETNISVVMETTLFSFLIVDVPGLMGN